MTFCDETVSTMMENFIKKVSKENGPSIEDIDAELAEVEGTLSNEREYIIRLHNLRAKRYKELEFINKLEKSFGKDRNQMMKTITANNDQSFTIDDDKLYMCNKLPGDAYANPYGKDIYKYSLVMTKEVFQECYNRWINPQEDACDRIESGTDGNPYKMWISGGSNSKDSDTE